MAECNQILEAGTRGEAQRAEDILPLLYTELRRLATQRLTHERPGLTLQATALVHEAWLRRNNTGNHRWNGRAHFFAAAAEAMRRILVEYARRKQRGKHGGDCERVEMDPVEITAPLPDDELLAQDEALNQIAELDASAAELVKLRFFAGLTQADAAGQMDIFPLHGGSNVAIRPRLALQPHPATSHGWPVICSINLQLSTLNNFHEANHPVSSPVMVKGSGTGSRANPNRPGKMELMKVRKTL